MKTIKINTDRHTGKGIIKIAYDPAELPTTQMFNSDDVIIGNPSSPIAICFIYTWPQDYAPKDIRTFGVRLSNYAALTGYWRTTNGGKYAFANILSNPNINKILVLVFGQKDNGHLLVNALTNMWQYGTNEYGIINNCKAPNPKFEQVPVEGLKRVVKQADLLILRNLSDNDFEMIETVVKTFIQEPDNAISASNFKELEFYTNHKNNDLLYDDGARYEEPYFIDLTSSAKNVTFEEKNLDSAIGQSIQANNLADAIELVASYVFKNGSTFVDMRGIMNIESRSFTLTVMDPLQAIPKGFDEKYIEKYVAEFMDGKSDGQDAFTYTYHERIFKRWGNQAEKAINVLKQDNNTRRCLITLWDPAEDLGNSNPPCLDFIWFVIRAGRLELHATYRSHHLATVTKEGKLMAGEGALVPNLYALGTLQEMIAKEVGVARGPLVLNDYSGHLYVSKVK